MLVSHTRHRRVATCLCDKSESHEVGFADQDPERPRGPKGPRGEAPRCLDTTTPFYRVDGVVVKDEF